MSGHPAWLTLAPGEAVLRSGAANLMRDGVGIGGRLVLTDRRLLFHAHQLNRTRPAIDRPVADIAACEGFGMLRNGLAVRFQDGGTERFRVTGRAGWLELLGGPATG